MLRRYNKRNRRENHRSLFFIYKYKSLQKIKYTSHAQYKQRTKVQKRYLTYYLKFSFFFCFFFGFVLCFQSRMMGIMSMKKGMGKHSYLPYYFFVMKKLAYALGTIMYLLKVYL